MPGEGKNPRKAKQENDDRKTDNRISKAFTWFPGLSRRILDLLFQHEGIKMWAICLDICLLQLFKIILKCNFERKLLTKEHNTFSEPNSFLSLWKIRSLFKKVGLGQDSEHKQAD